MKHSGLVTATLVSVLLVVPVLTTASSGEQKVPATFRYPESQETIQLDGELKSNALTGLVVDPNGAVTSKALVERVHAGWGKRIEGVLTNSKGRFSFPGLGPGIYFLRISKPGFNTILLKVRVSTKAKSTVRVALQLSN